MDLISFSPITLEEVGSVDVTPCDDVFRIVEECRSAQRIWENVSTEKRVALLKRLRETIIERSEEIARTVHLETGKPRADAFNTEVMSSAAAVKEYERMISKFKFVQKVDQGSMKLFTKFLKRRSFIRYRPLGVIGIISPYNFPFSIPFIEVVASVTAGNGVVLKPSSETPLSGELIGTLFRDSGFPEGLVKVIHGPGVGGQLSKADVDKIIFTGSTHVGKEIMKSASERLVPVTLELGGKDAMIVLDDADLERTVKGAVWGSFVNAGQVCVGVKRIFVHSSVYEEFKERFVELTVSLKTGDGWNDPSVSVGPMINQCELERMEHICKNALEQGGKILTGGKRPEGLKGHFFEPTVIERIPHSSDIVGNEIFGPVVTLFEFSDISGIAETAADCCYALGGSVWSKDIEKAMSIAYGLRSGSVDVNNTSYTFGLPATPWGGRRMSGFGTTHGMIGFKELMFPHHIHVDKGKYHDPWWMPYDKEKADAQKEMIDAFFGTGKGKVRVLRKLFPILRNKR
jgi:NAD-dependent aldehyde dehydrogenases